jgi:hypothetical protein
MNRVHDLEEALSEERKVNMKLRHEAESKLEQIARIDEALAKATEEHKWTVMKLKRDTVVTEEEFVENTEELDRTIEVVSEELSAFSHIEDHNEMLHARLKDVSRTYFEEKTKWAEDAEFAKKAHFDLRMNMDKILRRTLRSFRNGYRQRAIEDMGVHVIQARVENDKLRNERNRKDRTVGLLMDKQAQGFEKKTKAHIEMEVMATNAKFQAQRADRLTSKVKAQENYNGELLKEFVDFSKSVDDLKVHYQGKVRLSHDLKRATDDMEAQRNLRNAVRADVVQRCQAMMRDAMYLTEQQRGVESDNLVDEVLGPGGLESIHNECDDETSIASFQDELLDLAVSSTTPPFPGSGSFSKGRGPMAVDPELMWKTTKVDNAMLFSAPLQTFLRKTRRGGTPKPLAQSR